MSGQDQTGRPIPRGVRQEGQSLLCSEPCRILSVVYRTKGRLRSSVEAVVSGRDREAVSVPVKEVKIGRRGESARPLSTDQEDYRCTSVLDGPRCDGAPAF